MRQHVYKFACNDNTLNTYTDDYLGKSTKGHFETTSRTDLLHSLRIQVVQKKYMYVFSNVFPLFLDFAFFFSVRNLPILPCLTALRRTARTFLFQKGFDHNADEDTDAYLGTPTKRYSKITFETTTRTELLRR